jgi:hypothetical protein
MGFSSLAPVLRSRSLLPRLSAALAISAIVGCTAASGSTGSSSSVPCDPLAPPPTTLSGILGVGQDAAGTLYVADMPPGASQPRVFVSGATQLVRQHVAGSGEAPGGTAGTTEYSLTFVAPGSDIASAQALLLQVQGGSANEMALGPADSKGFLGGPDTGDTMLTLVDPSAVSGLTIVNLPGVVGYVADVSDGTAIAITGPMDGGSSADLHLFYGTPGAMVERTIVSFNQALSGYPTIGFMVGSATYTMRISGTFDPDAGSGPGPGTLDTGSATLPFTLRLPTPTTLSGFSFTCLGQ